VEAGYRKLLVWQRSMDLVQLVFGLTERLPPDQRFGLVAQMQRAAVSIPSNLAEGHSKRSRKDYRRHALIAAGSLAELETQIELTVRLGFHDRDAIRDTWSCAQEVAKMLSKLITSLSQAPDPNL
jgi:four helix bundle protein